jgi:hypothetical protein
MVVTGLNDKQMEALRKFLERLKSDPSGNVGVEEPSAEEPKEVPADGIEFGDGRRWDNPRGAPFKP